MPVVASARANNTADGQKDRQVCRLSRCPGSNFATPSFRLHRVTYSPHDGAYFAALGQVSDIAYLYQPIPTTPGQRYLLSFWLQNTVGEAPNEFLVQWDTNSPAPIFDQTDMGSFAWTTYQFTVTATGALTTLQVGNRNDNSYFGLDDVSVTPVPAPVVVEPILSAAPVITSANAPALQLSWTAVPESTYQIQSTGDLLDPTSWVPFGSSIVATNNNITISTPTTLATTQFYRLKLVQ